MLKRIVTLCKKEIKRPIPSNNPVLIFQSCSSWPECSFNSHTKTTIGKPLNGEHNITSEISSLLYHVLH